MFLALLITAVYCLFVWLVFFRLKWIKFNIAWGIVTAFVGLHVLLIFLIGVRFVTPYSTDATVVQHTIQLIPRLSEPTLVTGVLVKPNEPVKKGQPLFQFDRRPYEYQVNSIKAQLAAAQQTVLQLKAELKAAIGTVAKARAQQASLKAALDSAVANLADARAKSKLAGKKLQIAEAIAKENPGAISKLRTDQAAAGLEEAKAAVKVAEANVEQARVNFEQVAKAAIRVAVANEENARLACTSEIDGVNTSVAQLNADLALAQFYLDNTTMLAPADGYIINLQVREGMVAGILRAGAIATFIVDADRYLLATYNQEVLKWVEPEQPVEVALDLYPGQIFQGKVEAIWRGNRRGQYLPSGELPRFGPTPPDMPQGRFAVQIILDDPDESKFPIGTQGAAAIYTSEGGFAALRRIGIRSYSWFNWLYPLPF